MLSGRDDFRGALANMAVVTSIGPPLPVTVLAGMALGTTVLALHLAYQVRRFATMKANVAAEFPTNRPRPTLVPPTE
jgi:hypothetical protein